MEIPTIVKGFLEDLFHNVHPDENEIIHAYDAAKAREYYLRTRKLKGRKRGHAEDPKGRRPGGSAKARALRRRKAAEARVKKLKARLEKLKKLLEQLVKQAKARSGVETKSTTSKPSSSSKDGKKLTAAQKREAAKKAKEYREKNDTKASPEKEAKELEAKIKAVREKIAKMRKQIAAAKKKSQARKV